MRQTTNGRQKYYFSAKLKAALSQISQYPLTVVEAPSGFGKTTAIKEYLRSEHPQAVCEWYTCLGEAAPIAWNGICGLFATINATISDGLKNLKAPAKETLSYVAGYLKSLKCRGETFLIIDNYQLINFDMHRELINVFSMHENPDLHIIFITQQLNCRQPLSVHNNNIYKIDTPSLFFDKEGISSLFRMEGLRLTANALDSIFRRTEGWISAICLQMINYKETGSFVFSTGIEQLVERAVWSRLQPEEKDLLLMVSVFDSFTAHQAAAMLDNKILPGGIEAELKNNDFIRFLPDKRLFIIHGILLDYLRNRFYCHLPKEYQNQIFYKAGRACAATEQYCLATKYFYQIRNFEAIFSLPFTRQYLDTQKENCEEELFVAIVRECPAEVLCKYPATTLVFAHYALLNGQYGLYEKLCKLLGLLVREKGDLPKAEMKRLTAELILLESLGEFNDLAKMREGYAAACEVLGESPDNIENSMPWFSVFPTAFGMFWRESGKLDEMLDTADELKPFYRKFSRGQGAGLSHLIRAEAMLLRGEDNEAEICCHKAIYEARTYRQVSISIYAELCLARIFILRGDTENFSAALKKIQSYAADHSELTTGRMADMCLSVISLLLGIKDYIAPWLYDIESIQKSLYVPVLPFAEILYFKLLLIDKRYNELYAVSQLALDALRNPDAKIKYMMPQMYYLIFIAVAKHSSGNHSEAGRHLKEALDIALPDQIYLPFTEHESIEGLLSSLNPRSFSEETLPAGDSNSARFAALLALHRRQANGSSVIKKALLQHKSPLTPREREVALLARGRMSAKEMAAKLYISEKTVNTILRNIYGKLEIHSKNDLIYKDF